jgi:hypothetical protein
MEISQLVLEKKILKKILSVFLLFCYYLPLAKGNPLDSNNLDSPPPKDDLSKSQWFWRRSRKCKILQTDGRRTTGDQKSSLELSTEVS